jgi:hypothetical protein
MLINNVNITQQFKAKINTLLNAGSPVIVTAYYQEPFGRMHHSKDNYGDKTVLNIKKIGPSLTL